MNILALSPHPDDIEYACFGYLTKLSENNHITVAVLASDDETRLKEAQESVKSIGADFIYLDRVDGALKCDALLIKSLDTIFEGKDLILAPHHDDTHPDHRATAEAAKAAVRRKRISFLMYQTPSTGFNFHPDTFVELNLSQIAARFDAVRAHLTQTHRSYLTAQHLESKDRYWGHFSGLEFAEAYETYKNIL